MEVIWHHLKWTRNTSDPTTEKKPLASKKKNAEVDAVVFSWCYAYETKANYLVVSFLNGAKFPNKNNFSFLNFFDAPGSHLAPSKIDQIYIESHNRKKAIGIKEAECGGRCRSFFMVLRI